MTRLIRTSMVAGLTVVMALLAYGWLVRDQKQRAIDELTALTAEQDRLLARRQAMIERLSRSRRVGHIDILDQVRDDADQIVSTTLRFIELDDRGRELGRQQFTIPGAVLFVDAWTVKFSHEDVAEGDPLRGRTLILLRRMYSEQMAPIDGLPIDTPGAIPAGYADTDPSRFEQQVWSQFWRLASDRVLADAMGVRLAQGEAVYKRVAAEESYELIVDAAGGMNLSPLPRAAVDHHAVQRR